MLQLLHHLITNAEEALPEGGQIEVSAESVHVDKPPDDAVLPAAAGDYLRLRVRDNGVGISAQNRTHLFEPFFSAWASATRTGLGLSLVYVITRVHGGWLHVQTAEAQGTTVDVYFPLKSSEGSLDNKDGSVLHYQA